MRLFRKILKWTAITVGTLVAIGLITNGIFVWATDALLERQLAEIRAAGDPVTLAELARAPIPSEKNAATYLRRAEADLAAIEKATMNLHPVSENPGFMMTAEDQKVVRAAFAAYPNVLPLLEQAANCPDFDAEWNYSLPSDEFQASELLNQINKVRSPARVLSYQAALLVTEGKRDEAVRTALRILQLARHFDRNPTVVSYLVAIAVRGIAIDRANAALQTGPVSKDVRDALDRELAIHEPMQGYAWAIKSERAYIVDRFRTIVPYRSSWFIRGVWNHQESACLEVLRDYVSLAQGPLAYNRLQSTISRSYAQISGSIMPVAAQEMPAMKVYFEAIVRAQAMIRTLRVLNALQSHTPATRDEAPKLTNLGLPAQALVDPYNGKPLNVKKTPQGWLVYSVGPNLKDDGGDLRNSHTGDVGVGPPPSAKPEQDERPK